METKKNKQAIEKIKEKYIRQAFDRCGEVFEEKENEEGCESLTFDEIEDTISPYITTMINKVIKEPDIFIGHVEACKNSEFNGIDCLESNTQFGFFKSDRDIRPSSCTWIDKEDAERLLKLFKDKGISKE